MRDPLRFRRELAASILGLAGAASFAACESAGGQGTGGTATTTRSTDTTATGRGGAGGSAGTGAASTATGGGSTGGGGTGGTSTVIQPVSACFSFPIDAGADVVFDAGALPGVCPSDSKTTIDDFQALGCPSGWEPYKIVSGPTIDATGACCYMVLNTVCGPGGRPFLTGGSSVPGAEALVAPVDTRRARGWAAGDAPLLDGLTAADRAALARAWTTDALFEHASVASFARFSLSLLAAGAPAHLVELAHRAALDEVRHARLCFTLASAYAGEEIGPGPFPLGGHVRVDGSLADLAASTFAEGCLGETVAALVAAEQLARATDPAVRAALAEIADDEARHAELSWRTVAWAIQTGGDEVRAAVERALVGALAGHARSSGASTMPAGLLAHGRLDDATRAGVVASAVDEIVLPAARVLLGRRVGAETPVSLERA
jgi:hypothetical protein